MNFVLTLITVMIFNLAHSEPGRKADSPPPPPPKSKGHSDQWYACENDKNCIKGGTVCDGVTGINKKFKKPFEKYVKELTMAANCQALTPEQVQRNKDSTVSCQDKRCTIIAPKAK